MFKIDSINGAFLEILPDAYDQNVQKYNWSTQKRPKPPKTPIEEKKKKGRTEQ